ncbi:MAG: FAD-binding oxidoreductase, partial [Marinirhabdus sp.]
MAIFYKLKVRGVYKETDHCSVITFDVPAKLAETFKFRQGQHLTLKAVINGTDTRRSYSLCSSPAEGVWKVAVKQVLGGAFSTYVNEQLKAGDTLQVMPPSGTFGVKVAPKKAKNYLFFAAGSGITPIICMIKSHLEAEPKAN